MTPGRIRAPWLHVVALIAGGVVGALWYVLPGATPTGAWWVFLLAAIAGEFLHLETVAGRRVPTSVAVLTAFALLGNPPWSIAGLAIAAWLVSAVVRALRDKPVTPGELTARVAGGFGVAGLASIGTAAAGFFTVGGGGVEVSIGSIVAVTLFLVFASSLRTATHLRDRSPLEGARRELEDTWASTVTLASAAALTAVAYGVLGAGALLLMLLPILAVRAGLHRYLGIRRTYDQTIVAMSHMTELTGHVRAGHGVRVRELAIDVGRRLELAATDIAIIERAAYLHEIGRIATDDPEFAAPDEDVAQASARIIHGAGSMPQVTTVIARHRDPYRRPGTGDDVTLPVAARIVRTVCEFDRLAGDAVGEEVWTALDRLHRSMAYEHDPAVVGALVQVATERELAA